MAVRRNLAEKEQAARRERDADERDSARAHPPDRLLREPGPYDDPGRARQERETCLQWAVAEDVLSVQRREIEHREQPGDEEQHRGVRARQRTHAEDAEADQGRA